MSKEPGKSAAAGGARQKKSPKPGWRPHKRPAGKSAAAQPRSSGTEERPQLFGLHAVSAALQNAQRTIHTLYATQNAERRLRAMAPFTDPAPITVLPKELDRRLGADTVHQGVLAECDPLPDVSLQELIAHAQSSDRPLVVLDQVTDPHNVGAVLRSAAAFGASGLLMTRRHSPPLAGALAKAASGALEVVPVALEQNLVRSLETLKQSGFQVLGLEGSGSATLEDTFMTGPAALVLGAEGKGLRQSTRDCCTGLCSITTDGPIDSLNISNAAAVALYLHAMYRRGALRGRSAADT